MTPERLAMLQRLLASKTVDWRKLEEVIVREPVEPKPHRPGDTNVVDLPVIRRIRFQSFKGTVALHSSSGLPLTPACTIVWIEAEGYVIAAWSEEPEGETVAEDMVGLRSPRRGGK